MLRQILIVDDNEINRQVLRHALCDEYDVLEAANGEIALAVMRQKGRQLSAILLDILMPVMDGYEVLTQMRQDAALSQIPVIIMTSSTEESAEVRALTLGANDFITKPYNPAIVRQRLQNTIRLRETAAAVNVLQRDDLTGLYNRKAFFEKAAERIAEQPPGFYILACFNVNGFKAINDQFGIPKGDEVLRQLAQVFREGFGPVGGLCCRISDDIFSILYPRSFLDSPALEAIRSRASLLDGSMLPISFSIGRYAVDDLSLPVSAMYDRAALALASVKGRYDVNIGLYDESMREELLRERAIADEMNDALAGGQFEVWLQPQYNHSSGALIGAEALVRWRHPKRGIIPPYEFIPLFERNGFIYEMDKYVWEQSCILLRRWIDTGSEPLPVSVNISRYDLFREDLFSVLCGLVKKYDLPVSLLRLEITESAFAQSTEQIIRTVKQLINYGFTVEIDDFGSGYSSLNTLKNVPANILKLDMKFLESSDDPQRGENILESIIHMATWLGMPVIAEGVETAAQADYLRSIGCFYVQGFLYARPMPVLDYEALSSVALKEAEIGGLPAIGTLPAAQPQPESPPEPAPRPERRAAPLPTQKLVTENRPAVLEHNARLLTVSCGAGIFIFALAFVVGFFSQSLSYMQPFYAAIIAVFLLMLLVLRRLKGSLGTAPIYLAYAVLVIYSAVTSAFVSPNYICVTILCFLLLFPALFLDLSWRIDLSVCLSAAAYLAAVIPRKEPALVTDEIVNVASFAILGCIIGSFTRRAMLENFEMKKKLEVFAYSDTLTGLANRRSFFEMMEEAESSEGSLSIFSFAMIDIDGFKEYNDTHGHQAGDECLRRIGACFRVFQREYGVNFYRYGGEEFVAVNPTHTPARFREICEMCRRSIEAIQIKNTDGTLSSVTVSFGIAEAGEHTGRKYEALLFQADKALYAAKSAGKNRLVCYSELENPDSLAASPSFRRRK